MKNEFTIGQEVENLGIIATIESFHPVTGDPILRDRDGMKWLADAAKCRPVMTTMIHPDALVIMD